MFLLRIVWKKELGGTLYHPTNESKEISPQFLAVLQNLICSFHFWISFFTELLDLIM